MSNEVLSIRTVPAKGQVTNPVAIRRKLGIEAGAPVRFIERDGVVVLEKVEPGLKSLCGILSSPRSASDDDMDRAVGDAIAERFSRKHADR